MDSRNIFDLLSNFEDYMEWYSGYMEFLWEFQPDTATTILLNLLVSIGIYSALSILLFKKKRNIALVAVLAFSTLVSLFQSFSAFTHLNGYTISRILDIAASALLTVFALALCEQTIIKADLSKIKEIANKFFYLPAVMWIVGFVAYCCTFPGRFASSILSSLIHAGTMLCLAAWLKNPYVKETPTATDGNNIENAGEQDEAYCGLGKHILLLLFTCGIWYLIWTYRTTKYLNKTPNAEYYNPTNKLLLCLFVPFYSIYWFYKHGQRIDSFSKSKGLNNSDMATLCLILGIFIPFVACIIMQDKINALCTSKNINTISQEPLQTADELKKFKELLDSGIITQEEFDAKKKQLLGL